MKGTQAPKKPKSAYWIFAQGFFANYKPKTERENKVIRFKLCGQAFQALSKEELEYYKKLSQQQMEEYEKAVKEFNEKNVIQSQESDNQHQESKEIRTEKKPNKIIEDNNMIKLRTKKRQELEEELSKNDSIVQMSTQGPIVKKRSEVAQQNIQKIIIFDKNFPNESEEYREKRKALLQAEIDLRAYTEEVNKMRRDLPKGGKLKANYNFTEMVYSHPVNTEFKNLFEQGKNTLIIYSLMFDEEYSKPCSQCNSIIDSWNGAAKHIQEKVNFVVVANINIEKLAQWAEERQLDNIRFLSCLDNKYNLDYFGEDLWGHSILQMPMLNVFEKDEDGQIYHFWGSEMLYVKFQNEENRHIDSVLPVLNMFDFTREGRGSWKPKIDN